MKNMKNKRITFEEIEKNQFLLIKYYNKHNSEKNYILAKVINDKKEIEEFGVNYHNRLPSLDRITDLFELQNVCKKKKLVKENGNIQVCDENEEKKLVTEIFEIDSEIIKIMAETRKKRDEAIIKNLQDELEKFKVNMQYLYLLEKVNEIKKKKDKEKK